jgi:hypothetical protein
LCFDEKYNIINAVRVAAPSIRCVPWTALASCWPRPQQLLPASAAGSGRRCCSFSPYRHLSAPGKEIFLEISLPRTLEGGKGGCTMTFEQVVLLLTLLGGAIYVTFEITWTVSHSDRRKKK